ncbi:MAG: hypothetical protein GY807_04060, partial [Gammaproteobacteria bacterium]|nr:hypothetical protein [Gammaproteobacteria bacterium]
MRLQKLITAIILASLIYQPFYAFGAQELALPAPDISVPKIEHEQLSGHQAVGELLELSVKVVDDSGVKKVTLFYRVIGAKQFKRLEMIAIGGQGVYTTTIPPEDMLAPGLEYYIQAADTAGNTVLRGFEFS